MDTMPNTSQGSLYAVLKVAEICNIGCTYCYFFFAGDDTHQDRPQLLSARTAEAVAEFLHAGALDVGAREVTVSLHGGEPMMMGKRRFQALCKTLRDRFDGPVKLRLDTQTNAILVDDEWIAIFSEFDVGVGVSLDGPASINDHYRVDKRGRGTHDETVRGLRRLQEAAVAGLIREPAIICVLTELSDAATLFDYFYDVLGVSLVFFRPPLMDWDDYSPQTLEAVRVFYRELLAIWLRRDDPRLQIHWFRELFAGLLATGQHALGPDEPAPFTIRTDGALGPHDAFAPKHEKFRHTGYAVDNSHLRDFLAADFWRDVNREPSPLPAECSDCKWAGICGGGLVENRYQAGDAVRRKTVYCEVSKDICGGLYEYAATAVPREVLDERLVARLRIAAQAPA